MKKIIIKLLLTGYSNTKKYKVADIENYFWPLRGLFKDTPSGIQADNNNSFWNDENHARADLVRDLINMEHRNIKDTYYYRILNRCANGDAYGIPYHLGLGGENK